MLIPAGSCSSPTAAGKLLIYRRQMAGHSTPSSSIRHRGKFWTADQVVARWWQQEQFDLIGLARAILDVGLGDNAGLVAVV
ncbi:unnamed protein product [Urochloa humidicola]